jgi:hypothetical protein
VRRDDQTKQQLIIMSSDGLKSKCLSDEEATHILAQAHEHEEHQARKKRKTHETEGDDDHEDKQSQKTITAAGTVPHVISTTNIANKNSIRHLALTSTTAATATGAAGAAGATATATALVSHIFNPPVPQDSQMNHFHPNHRSTTHPRILPSHISTAIAGIRWPLDAHSSPPLHYQPLEKLAKIRKKQFQTSPPSCPIVHAMVLDVLGTISDLIESSKGSDTSSSSSFSSSSSSSEEEGEDDNGDEWYSNNHRHYNYSKLQQKPTQYSQRDAMVHYARIAVAVLLLGHGFTDEAHCLIAPLTWNASTSFGYGPPIATRPDVLATGSYAHALIHLREGFQDSEYGMTGFGNAKFWISGAMRGLCVETLPLAMVFQVVSDLVARFNSTTTTMTTTTTTNTSTPSTNRRPPSSLQDSESVQQWYQTAIVHHMSSIDGWEPRILHELCAKVMKQNIAIVATTTTTITATATSEVVSTPSASTSPENIIVDLDDEAKAEEVEQKVERKQTSDAIATRTSTRAVNCSIPPNANREAAPEPKRNSPPPSPNRPNTATTTPTTATIPSDKKKNEEDIIILDPALCEFASLAVEAELRVLLGHALQKLGFDCGNCLREQL